MRKPLTALEDASLRTIVATQEESEGWLDLARICSRTGRHLGDVRQAIARLVRYKLIHIDETAPNTERWIKVSLPNQEVIPSNE